MTIESPDEIEGLKRIGRIVAAVPNEMLEAMEPACSPSPATSRRNTSTP